MDDLTSFLFSGTNFTEEEIETASANYSNQVDLFDLLHETFTSGGFTYKGVAEELGVTEELAEELLTAQRDMTLTELRMLANTLHVVIEYRIVPPSN